MDLAQQLRRDEGEELSAYQDHLGFWTIGVGHLIDKRKGGKIPPHISQALLEWDIQQVTIEVYRALPWMSQLDPVRAAAVLNMAFQLGTPGLLEFKNMLAALRDQRWALAASHALDSKWAKADTPDRARRVARQLETGEWQ